MSGIVGIVNLDGKPIDRELLRRMTDSMAYRGPDAQEIWIDGHVGFGHTMLRTTFESEHDHQPCSLDGQVWITADARIDARDDLIRQLRSKGRQIQKSVTDVELTLHAYHVWGDDCVQHLIGDFAFAIWEGPQQRLFCARDHFGVKPFYYANLANYLVFSNTLDCLRLHPAVSDELNDLAIGDFLLFGYNQEPFTSTFADIQRLPAAHYLTWSEGVFRLKHYWTLPTDGHIRYKRSSEYVDHFRELLQRAVDDRIRADHVGISMSGGLDSSTVAATAKELSRRGGSLDLRAFTMVYDRLISDQERYYSGLVAKALSIPIRYLVLDDYALYERWDEPELRCPEPNDFPLTAHVLDHLTRIAAHSRVMLSGDGGDPVLLHSRLYFDETLKNFRLGTILACIGRHLWLFKRFPRIGFHSVLSDMLGLSRPPWRPPYPIWLNDSFAARLDLRARYEQRSKEPEPVHPTRPEAYRSLTDHCWQNSFERADPGWTCVPVEGRYPFFDLRLVNYLLAIPPIPWFVSKDLLRASTRGILPEPIRLRPKTPLAEDPLLKRLQHRDVDWIDHFDSTPELAEYVDRNRVPTVAGANDCDQYWVNMGPLSLNYWLKNLKSFEYKNSQEKYYEATG
jgi:asparagine synthase (glutamine-hydrolysing)